MKRTLLTLTLLAICAAPGVARADAWEIVRKCTNSGCDSNLVPTAPSATVKQYSRAYTGTPTANWAYFAIHVDTNARTRHIIYFTNITDARVAPIFALLEDAWRTGKKLRWMRNDSRNANPPPTALWQGYMNTVYQIVPGDLVEFIFD